MIEAGALLDGRYRLEEQIGAGGAGEVWRARHVTLNSIVAIKVLRVGASHKEVSKKRFLQEARFTAQLRIRQAVQVHDFGFIGERPYLVMELLKGETLKERLEKKGKLSVRETATILRQAARALERAHALGIVHRDFKPDNVFVLRDEDGEDEVRVVDFGIAKLVGGFEEEEEPASALEAISDRGVLTSFTRTGGLLGTPYYMAPEQVQSSRTLGPEVDIWALGVVAFECLTGKRPFDGENAGLLFKAILDGEHIPLKSACPELPKAFSTWFRTACDPDPSGRFTNARNAVATLEEALGVLPIVGPSWLEATDPSIALRQVQRTSLPEEEQSPGPSKTSSSLSGTATAVQKRRSPHRRAALAMGLVLVAAAVGVGILAGRQEEELTSTPFSAAPSESEAPAAASSDEKVDPPPPASTPPPSVSSSTVAAEDESPPKAKPTSRPVRSKLPRANATKTKAPDPPQKPPVEPKPPPPATGKPTTTKAKPPSPLDLPPLGI